MLSAGFEPPGQEGLSPCFHELEMRFATFPANSLVENVTTGWHVPEAHGSLSQSRAQSWVPHDWPNHSTSDPYPSHIGASKKYRG